MKNTLSRAALLTLSLLLLSACGKKEEPPAAPTGIPVEVQTVARGSISTENKLSGSVVSDKTEQIFVSVSARCVETYVEAGDTVANGAALLKLDLESFHDNYEIASLSHQNAVKNLEDQRVLLDAQVEQQERNYTNTLSLFEIGAASQLEVDGAKLALDSARVSRDSSLAQLELAIKNAEKSMKQITDTLNNVRGDGVVRAPFAGTIVSLNVARDGYVSAGAPVAVIDSTNNMKLEAAVSESLIAKLSVGDSASVYIAALDLSFDTTVSSVSNSPAPSSRLYPVQLAVPRGTNGLLSGMLAEVNLYTDSHADAIVVPTESLLLQAEGQFVVLLDAESKASRVPVQTGLIGSGVTEVTSGLNGGETLVVAGQSYLKDGDLARIVTAEG